MMADFTLCRKPYSRTILRPEGFQKPFTSKTRAFPPFGAACGVPGFDTAGVEESVRILKRGTVDYEFRTTAVRELHTPEVVGELAAWIVGDSRYFLQSFKDSGDLVSEGCSACSREEMERFLAIVRREIPGAAIRGAD